MTATITSTIDAAPISVTGGNRRSSMFNWRASS
jgi:hypothetical protein